MSANTLRAAIQASHSTASKPRTRPSCQRYVRINPSPKSNLAPRDVENQHTVSTPEGNDKPRMYRAIPIAVFGLQQTLRARRRDGGNAATNVHHVGVFDMRFHAISDCLSLEQIGFDRGAVPTAQPANVRAVLPIPQVAASALATNWIAPFGIVGSA
jgi:hypothetical protein